MLTNEEKRVGIYAENQPIRPETVTPETPLDALNLNWTERDLPERERTKHVHRLHPYLGKFIPQLVEVFLRKYFAPGQTVLDPFVGSGTTLVQANELGIHSVGYDISAFNVLLCQAKTAQYDLDLMQNEVLDILERTRRATQRKEPQLSLLFEHQAEYTPSTLGGDTEYLLHWYAPRALQELLTYRSFIDTGNYRYKHLLKIILSRSARSARLTPHYELDFPKQPQREPYWCHKHHRICEPTDEAYKFLHRYSLDTIRRIREFALVRTDARVEVYHADSRTAQFPPVDGVFTSPPYVGLIDYHEQHAYAYHLLGLQDLREGEIGAAANGSSERAKAQYVQDICAVFRNALKAMPQGGRLIVVANDKYGLYPIIAEQIGVEQEAVLHRHVNRRTGRRSSEFFESVFIWRKS
ncbi:MAG: class I SAM-dependent methyltransferase [Chthonomonadetes bacterium]|nr:class I SAM-dependent methyltransferase [Chthonomonadetes bacterium]